jgi:hypothetical protein
MAWRQWHQTAAKISEAAPHNNQLRGSNDNNSKSNKEGKDNKGKDNKGKGGGSGGDEGGASTTANGNKDSAWARYYITIN